MVCGGGITMKKLLYILLFLLAGLIQAQTINIANTGSAVNITNNGTDLISGWDFTSGWTTVRATIDDANSFTATDDNGIVRNNGYIVTGTRYRMRIAGTVSVGNFIVIRYDNGLDYSSTLSGTFDSTFDFTCIILNGIALKAFTSGAVVDITKMEIRAKTSDYINVGN